MRRWFINGVIGLVLCLTQIGLSAPIIVDHTSCDLTQVPQDAIQNAKDSLHIAYGHTSHGSQLTTGMTELVDFVNGGGLGLSYQTDFFEWNNGGTGGALDLHDYAMGGDVGYYPAWVDNTRTYLDNPANADVNVIIWSWCGQVSSQTEQSMIDTYLAPMTQLETEYPNVLFVYMTGHADGTGETGNLHLRNQQIRDYCIANDKVLYDFYDIECYDPDGNYYGDKLVNDNCDYDSNSDGSRDANWATDWQNAHTENVDWYTCSSAHSQPLNANRKAYAAWWLWARLAGWEPDACLAAPSNLTAYYNEEVGQIVLNWIDNSGDPDEHGFLIQRQPDGGAWDNEYASVGPNVTTYSDPIEGDGTYRYRVVAIQSDEGGGVTCMSSASNIQVVAVDHSPAAPSDLTYAIVGGADIQLNWTDNSDDETSYIVERRIDDSDFQVLVGELLADTTAYLDESLTAGHTYSYRVQAQNPFGYSDYSNVVSAELSLDIPNTPSALQCVVSGNRVDLSWTDNSDNETGFVLERQVDGGVFGIVDDMLAADTTTYADTSLDIGHVYVYRVYAYNAYGNSGYSNTTIANLQVMVYTVILETTAEVDDSFLNPSYPDRNYGASGYTSGTDLRYIFKFNFPSYLTGKRIVKADLRIHGWAHSGTWTPDLFMDLYRVSRSWDELEVTWNDALYNDPWITAGGDYDRTVGQVQIAYYDDGTGDIDTPLVVGNNHVYYPPADITDIVKRWVRDEIDNHGLLLVNNTDYTNNFKASEYDDHTYLEITYIEGCGCDIPADFDYNCRVDLDDFAAMAFQWNQASTDVDIAPAGGDGFIDLADLTVLADLWLVECSGQESGEGEGGE